MSGFVALLTRRNAEADGALLARLANPLAAPAADGARMHVQGSVGFAHALLAARENAGPGPHRSARGTCVTGDIRIDAQRELREALRAAGERVAPDATDEALLLFAWEAWGEDSVARLRGDFSFALWDPARRVLFCARDAFGVRPLYYAELGDAFVCSNVLAAVRAHPSVRSTLHEPAILSFLCHGFNVDLTTTSFSDVRRLAPAHQLSVSASTAAHAPRRHWSFPAPAPLLCRREEEYVERYRAIMDDAVRDRLRVPRAAIMLSGGLDSTSIAATIRRVAPDTTLLAYTSDVSSMSPSDDARLARLVAGRLELRHEVVAETPVQLAHLADAAFHPPEPLDEPEYLEWRRCARRLSRESPIVFIGEDGDALFKPPGLRTMFRRWPVIDVLSRVLRFAITHRRHPHLGIWLRRRLRELGRAKRRTEPPWLRGEAVTRIGLPRAPGVAVHPARALTKVLLLGPVWQSVFEILEPAYSGAALATRWPLLDTRLLEFVLSIPPVPWCQSKELVRVAFRGELPEEVLQRPKAVLPGYGESQVEAWRAAWNPRGLSLGARVREFVDTDRVRHYLQEGSADQVRNAWRVLALDHWLAAL